MSLNSESKQKYYVNNNFTNIQINMNPNFMNPNQMGFPYNVFGYNMNMP